MSWCTAAQRMMLATLGLVAIGCGGRLTPPDIPPERAEIDRLARARDAGSVLSTDEQRRLAVLLDRYDNAPARADLIDAEINTARARQARAWRAWARQSIGWAVTVAQAIITDPQAPGSAALAAVLDHAPPEARRRVKQSLQAARGRMGPLTGCLVDRLWSLAPPPCAEAVGADREAVYAALAGADPRLDPESDRLRWTLARWGLAPRPAVAAEAADRWLRHWPRHADAWTMAGASAAADRDATPAERLAWSGAAWQRAIELSPTAVRAHLALAHLESLHGLPAVAERHRLDAQRAVGDDRPLPERWAEPPVARTASPAHRAARDAAEALRDDARAGGATVPRVVLDRAELVVPMDGMPVIEVQRFATQAWPPAPGCTEARIGERDALYAQSCRAWAVPVAGVVEIAFQTAWATARGEIIVRTPTGMRPGFESHGGAPGATVLTSSAGQAHRFTLDGIDPPIEGPRRPRIRVRLPDAEGLVDPPQASMVDRLVALAAPISPPPVLGDTRRTVARLRAAGIEAEQVWVAVDARPVPLVARFTEAGWRWFDAAGAVWAGDGAIIAATRAAWVGRTPAAITRAATADLPSSNASDPPRSGRP